MSGLNSGIPGAGPRKGRNPAQSDTLYTKVRHGWRVRLQTSLVRPIFRLGRFLRRSFRRLIPFVVLVEAAVSCGCPWMAGVACGRRGVHGGLLLSGPVWG